MFAAYGTAPAHTRSLSADIETATPSGESPDEVSATAAQDCWICADVAVRVLVDDGYEPGPAIEYALEPILDKVTEELYGVTQLGSGPDEDEQVDAVLRDSRIVAAFGFVRWATDAIGPEPDEQMLDALRLRAAVLTP